jgi:hypothetical protein
MTFEIGDFVYLKVSPLKGMQRFQLKGKLAPRYVGPFKVLSHRGEVSYQLELPEEMSAVHDVFHISLLRKCLEVPKKTEVFKNIDHRSVDINQDLTYREVPIHILEEAYRTTRTRSIKFLKIQWSNHTEDEATWEREEDMRNEYPDLFSTYFFSLISRDEIFCKGEGFVTSQILNKGRRTIPIIQISEPTKTFTLHIVPCIGLVHFE